MAKGLDIGTGFFVSARIEKPKEKDAEETQVFKSFRNLFIVLEANPFIRGMLKKNEIPHIEVDKQIYALGAQALEFASALNSTPHRPMAKGVINPLEQKALPILKAIIEDVLGKPASKGEKVVYSNPANPVDAEFNNVYHRGMFEKILTDLGYTPVPLNEGLAIIYSDLINENLSGIGVSFGAGMCNVCCAIYGQEIFSFSIASSGDYVDTNVANALAITNLKALKAKERFADLSKPSNSTEEAIQFYYKHMLTYVALNINEALSKLPNLPDFDTPPTVVVSGGTSLPEGFTKLFEDALKAQSLPLKLGQIRKAEDPLKATARGCLFAALEADS